MDNKTTDPAEVKAAAIAQADKALAAAGLPTYSQLVATIETMAAEECAA